MEMRNCSNKRKIDQENADQEKNARKRRKSNINLDELGEPNQAKRLLGTPKVNRSLHGPFQYIFRAKQERVTSIRQTHGRIVGETRTSLAWGSASHNHKFIRDRTSGLCTSFQSGSSMSCCLFRLLCFLLIPLINQIVL